MVGTSSNTKSFKEIDLNFNSCKLYTNGHKLYLEFLKNDSVNCNHVKSKKNNNLIFMIFFLAIFINLQRICVYFNLYENKKFIKYYKLLQKYFKKYNLVDLE